ncbi:hypothetical protein AHAS_Ahas16G0210000 [Arachis hypogaea]
MSYFSVVPNQGNYRAAEHEFKLVFLNRTTVIPVPDDAIPKTCFSFCPFDELLKMTEDYAYLVDVIGLLTSVDEEKEYVKDGKYVDEVHRFLGSGYMEQPVVVIQLAKVKFFGGQFDFQNVMHATCLFFNPDLAEVVDFKNSMVDQGINGTQPLFIVNEGKGVLLEDDFMRLTKRCTIEEFHDNNESIQPQGGAYYCDFCQHYVTNVTLRYRIKITVADDNRYGVFVLFDREATYLLKKSCVDLFGDVQKDATIAGKKLLLKIDTKIVGADKYFRTFRVRRVCDDVAIIAMFELPNYDADDEHTPVKDGYLGKIPSSDHEYIIGKKDPCEVLDEGITSDGNCSNMKTNCRPLIDFLGEKGAEVPRLDDISSEVDIMKEKEKTVDDSVLVNRECSLEIESVLSAVLDGSPVHMIKKETVYNPPRGEKVKRNMKKAFDDVADEELGPTSKVLKNRDL